MSIHRLVISGGHHTSALVVAKILRFRGWDVYWFGHRHSMWQDASDSVEYQEVSLAGFPFYDLKAGKFYRTFHPLKLLRLPVGFIQAFYYLLVIRPTGILSFGGYLAVPTVVCGWLLGIPAIFHEQTTVAGWANRAVSRLAKKICLTFPDTAHIYPVGKTVVTGLPLRPEIANLKQLPSSTPPTILVSCGKQGSHAINSVIFQVLPKRLKHYHLIHQTGSSSLYSDFQIAQKIRSLLPAHLSSRYAIYRYLPDHQQAQALGQADLVIGRSGGHFTYELGYLGKRSVLIPLPNSSHNEQYLNALLLSKSAIALILLQVNLSPDSLLTAISQAMRLKPVPLPLPVDASERLVKLVEEQFL